ncbi:MAG TPA: hypothetical protein VEB21_08095 [Terriglobales bacterium]|nr:hypothetical protein [Terriglobales bacterium]
MSPSPPLLKSLLVIALFSSVAHGEVSTDQPGAILVFPKIESSETTDTIIQITNNSGNRVFARCFYIDGRVTGELPTWLITDFQTTLTRQQPTFWVAGIGLPAVPPDRPEDLYPGPIPPVAAGFLGELRCIVVDESENPIGRNALTGEATLIDRISGSTRKYQATAIRGFPANDGNNTLLLNESEYSSCPRLLLMNHFFDDAPDPLLAVPIRSRLTVVPCSMDLESSVPGQALLQFDVFNEFEQRLSRSLAVVCFETVELSRIDSSQPQLSIFNYALQGTLVGFSRIQPVADDDSEHGHGVLGILEEVRGEHAAAANLHFIGGNLQTDVVVLPDPF